MNIKHWATGKSVAEMTRTPSFPDRGQGR